MDRFIIDLPSQSSVGLRAKDHVFHYVGSLGLGALLLWGGLFFAAEPGFSSVPSVDNKPISPMCELTLKEEGFSLPQERNPYEATVSCHSIGAKGDVQPSAEVVIENGTIGILKVRAIVDVSRSQDLSSLVLVLEDSDFDRLVKINKHCRSSVQVTLSSPHSLTFALVKANFQERRMLGRVKDHFEKVWVVPQRYSQDLQLMAP